MKCAKCEFEVAAEDKFCRECGNKLEIKCPQCERANPGGSKFCAECGQNLILPSETPRRDLSFDEKLAKIQRYLPEGLTEKILSQRDRIEGERKQVTVMFCDMEGFTGLAERLGPEEAYSIIDDVYEILIHKVHDYEGTVNEMTGDGIVALFGAPIALEDAPQRTIRSAMAIHREMVKFSERMKREKAGMTSLKMRVGIHSGPVVVGTLGNDLRVDFKAVGDTVNLASRMEELARPGTTYVTEDTFKLTEGLFRFESLGQKEIKGKQETTNVYQVIAPSTRRTRFDVSAERGLTPFVGRERELELLLDGFERAKSGRGQAFSIVAEAGIGKSRLLYEFRKAVSSEDITFLEGKCLSYGRGIAYHPVIDVLKANFDVQETDGDLQISEKVKKGLEIMGADEVSALPYLLELLSVEDTGIDKISMSPEARRNRIEEAVKRIVLRGSELRPLTIAFEDLHWIDRTSEDVLKSLTESIAGAKILLIFTYRPEFIHTWGGKSYHNQVNLNRLSNRESLRMVTHLLGSEDIGGYLEELILDNTEGVPFFIEEFLKSLSDLKIIEKKANRIHLTKDVQELAIPSTIQDVIMARIDSLPDAAKQVLQTGAVIDREFSYELLKQVTGLPQQELLSSLSGLKETELLYERGVFPKSTFIFKHALTQEVAYDGLLQKRREEIHQKIGNTIEALYADRQEENYELLAHHYSHSENKQKAAKYLDLANRKACRASAAEEAKGYFDQALAVLEEMSNTEKNRELLVSLLGNQTDVFELLLKIPEYYDILTRYEPMVGAACNPGLEGRFYASLGNCELAFGHFDQAVQTLKKAGTLCEAAGDAEAARYAYEVLMWVHLWKGDLEQTLMLRQDVHQKMQEKFILRTSVWSSTAASWACSFLGRWNEAAGHAKEALSNAQEYADGSLTSFAASAAALAYMFKCDLDPATEYAEMATQKAPTPFDEAVAQVFLGFARSRAGKTNKGIEILHLAIQMYRTSQYMLGLLAGLPFLCEAYVLAGKNDRARETAEEASELASRHGAKYLVGWVCRLLGEIALADNRDEVAPHFERAISIAREIKAENELALAYSGMGRFYKQEGDVELAREHLTKALEIFERLGTLIEPDKVRKELAEITQ